MQKHTRIAFHDLLLGKNEMMTELPILPSELLIEKCEKPPKPPLEMPPVEDPPVLPPNEPPESLGSYRLIIQMRDIALEVLDQYRVLSI